MLLLLAMAKYQCVRGMRDLLPCDSEAWAEAETVLRRVSEAHGFREIRTPIVEERALFERGVGASTDIVEKEMYSFEDRKGRRLALRPEGTASVVRAYIQSGPLPGRVSRFYYSGPMFRYDRPQKGRYRQFHQFGVELLGGAHPGYDGEVMDLLAAILRALKVADFRFAINTLGCETCRAGYLARLKAYLDPLRSRVCADCSRRISENTLRVLDCKEPDCISAVREGPVLSDMLCQPCRSHDAGVREYLDMMEIPYSADPHLVRGLDYYTATVFEVFAGSEPGAVAAGGRYDNLVRDLGGPDVPATGFAIGLERLMEIVPRKESGRPLVYGVFLGEAARREGMRLIRALRDASVPCRTEHGQRSLAGSLKTADRESATWCLILGDNEIAARTATVRDMRSGSQESVPIENVVTHFRKAVGTC